MSSTQSDPKKQEAHQRLLYLRRQLRAIRAQYRDFGEPRRAYLRADARRFAAEIAATSGSDDGRA